jgi:hypothetical protein
MIMAWFYALLVMCICEGLSHALDQFGHPMLSYEERAVCIAVEITCALFLVTSAYANMSVWR